MPHHAQSGFSLLQLSIILTVGALMLAATLPGGGGDEMSKQRITLERMEKIEAATQQFMANNRRRPFPSDLTAAFSAAGFGIEITPSTDYSTTAPTTYFTNTTSGSYNTTLNSTTATYTSTPISGIYKGWLASAAGVLPNSATSFSWVEGITSATTITLNRPASATSAGGTIYFRNPLAAGGVPTKTLGLPDEYAIDGYGRRIVYMVDSRVTTNSGCMALQNNQLKGSLALSSSPSFGTDIYDNVMWALMSYGKDGQGAVGIQGSALTARIKTGNTDSSTLYNAFYDSSQNKSFDVAGLVNKAATSTFDDIIWTNQQTKNTCGLGDAAISSTVGAVNSYKDFRINEGGVTDSIASAAFAGKSRVAQHQLVYAALKGRMGGELHALALQTSAPG